MSRITRADRKQSLLRHGVQLAQVVGVDNVTIAMLARKAVVSTGLVSLHFGTRAKLRAAIKRASILV